MENKIVDLHIHSYYSDGTMSPEEILNIARRKNIGLLAITDHDILKGSVELLRQNIYSDIKCISGVELDAIDLGINFHVLGYGVDLSNEGFNRFVRKNKKLLENVNIKLIEKIQKDYSNITKDDYENFEYDIRNGGWKALHYFIDKGLTESLFDGFKLYAKYEHSYNCVDFPTVEIVCKQIHNAGGKAILAHPGKVIKKNIIAEFSKELKKVIDMGIDGIECYYPSHSKEVTDKCLELCKSTNLLITCGSDCHGRFENTEIGELPITIDKLEIGDLYK